MPEATEPLMTEFFRYNAWANQQLLAACEKLSPDQLQSRAEGTYGTIYETIVHLVRAEASYLRRLTGERHPPPFNWDEAPRLAEIQDYAGPISEALILAAEHVRDTDMVQEEWEGETIHYKAIVLLIQAINHGVEHRTNITTILSQLGLEAPGVDGWGYLQGNTDRLGTA